MIARRFGSQIIRDDVSALLVLPKGLFSRIDDVDVDFVSSVAWEVIDYRSTPYVKRRHNGKNMRLHRHIMSASPSQIVDHINQDTLDNRRANLRVCTLIESNRNRGPSKGSSSMYKGVSYHKHSGKWYAKIKTLGCVTFLGVFAVEEEAARAYDRAAILKFGAFAWLNFPEACQGAPEAPQHSARSAVA